MIDHLANDPSLLLAVVAAVGLGVVLRRLGASRREAHITSVRATARHEFGLQLLAELQDHREESIDLEARDPIDLREEVDLRPEASPDDADGAITPDASPPTPDSPTGQ